MSVWKQKSYHEPKWDAIWNDAGEPILWRHGVNENAVVEIIPFSLFIFAPLNYINLNQGRITFQIDRLIDIGNGSVSLSLSKITLQFVQSLN